MVGMPASVSGSKGGNFGPWRRPGAPALGLGAVGGPGGTGGVGGCFPVPENNFEYDFVCAVLSSAGINKMCDAT